MFYISIKYTNSIKYTDMKSVYFSTFARLGITDQIIH